MLPVVTHMASGMSMNMFEKHSQRFLSLLFFFFFVKP